MLEHTAAPAGRPAGPTSAGTTCPSCCATAGLTKRLRRHRLPIVVDNDV